MDVLNLIPALIFAVAGLIAIFFLLRPIILALKPYLGKMSRKKRPHLYQVKIERGEKPSGDDKPDDIVFH